MREVEFVKDFMKRARKKGIVVGISGGVDSAVVAKLCADAIGSENVLGVMLPEDDSTLKGDMDDAREFAESIGIKHTKIDISNMRREFEKTLKVEDKTQLGNIKARIRMIVLYHLAKVNDYAVAGTGNKSEIYVGYSTKYGDGAADFTPISHLYKTQVWKLAKEIGIPEGIVSKIPSAGLWKDQTDEGELGVRYAELDKILALAIDGGQQENEIIKNTGIGRDKIKKVLQYVKRSEHKRKAPEAI